jgi:hypothetical protein
VVRIGDALVVSVGCDVSGERVWVTKGLRHEGAQRCAHQAMSVCVCSGRPTNLFGWAVKRGEGAAALNSRGCLLKRSNRECSWLGKSARHASSGSAARLTVRD